MTPEYKYLLQELHYKLAFKDNLDDMDCDVLARQLLNALDFDEGFSLHFVIYESANHLAFLKDVTLRYSCEHLVIPDNLNSHINEWVSNQILEKGVSTDTAIILHGLTDLFANLPERKASHINSLNMNRNAYQRLQRSVVFCIHEETAQQLRMYAPDFYDYRTLVVYTPEPLNPSARVD